MRKGRRHGNGSAEKTPDDRPKRKQGLSFGGEGSLRDGARVRRNVRVATRRTSVSLEVAIWDALADICTREDLPIDAVCDAVETRRNSDSLASSLRTFSLLYFRLSTSRREAAAAVIRTGDGKSVSDGPQAGFPTVFEEALSRFATARAAASEGPNEAG